MQDARIFVAAPQAMLGRAIVRGLARAGFGPRVLDCADIDLRDRESVGQFFRQQRPTHVFLAAGKKGGIQANRRYPADLLLDNLRIAMNVLEAALQAEVGKVLYVGSSCMYPRECRQPMREDMLLTGPLEPTSEAYAVGKLAGLHLCQAIYGQHGRRFVSAIPTNVYGPNDDFDPDNAHVVGGLIQKIAAARRSGAPEVCLWGTGRPRREFLYADDFGTACVFLMQHYDRAEPVNIASGDELSIRELAERIADHLGYVGELRFDASKPDGAPRKSLDGSQLMELGWRRTVGLDEGLRRTCEWYEQQIRSGQPTTTCKEKSCA